MIERAHLILYVRDQGSATAFYRAVLDTEPTLEVPGMTEFTLPGGAILGLMPAAGIRRLLGDVLSAAPSGDPTPRAELYLLVDDPGAYHHRSLAAGARELSPLLERDWGHRTAYSLDPDSHVLAFAAPLE